MSIPDINPLPEDNAARLLIDESPYQLLPSLAQILGDSEAIILQQLHFKIQNPYFADERLDTLVSKGRVWIRIEEWMWWDPLEGICRHLAERTFQRKKAKLVADGILDTTSDFNLDQDDNTLWHSINYPKLRNLENAHKIERDRLLAEREHQRKILKEVRGANKKWRPKIRFPELMAEASRHNGGTLLPVKSKPAKVAETAPPKRQSPSRQNGEAHSAKVAAVPYVHKEVHEEGFKNVQQKAAIAAGDGVVSSSIFHRTTAAAAETSSGWTPEKLGALEQRIIDFNTGIERTQVRRFLNQWPDHCQIVADYWHTLDESKSEFWIERNANLKTGQKPGSVAGALYLRLSNPEFVPPALQAERDAQAQSAAREAATREAAARQAQEAELEAERERAEIAARDKRRAEYQQIEDQYKSLPEDQRKMVAEEAAKRCGGAATFEDGGEEIKSNTLGAHLRQVMRDLASGDWHYPDKNSLEFIAAKRKEELLLSTDKADEFYSSLSKADKDAVIVRAQENAAKMGLNVDASKNSGGAKSLRRAALNEMVRADEIQVLPEAA